MSKIELPGLTVNTDPNATKPTFTIPGNGNTVDLNSTSTRTASSSHDAKTTVNGDVIHEEHTETGPTTVTGDAAQPADQQG